MKYDVTWSTARVIQRATIVMNFWNAVAEKAKEKLAQLQPAEREDKSHQGLTAKLKRMADAAKGQAWRAEVLLKEATDMLPSLMTGAWPWTSEDLLWFYPELASNDESLLQLGS